jgi:hypothetical protein
MSQGETARDLKVEEARALSKHMKIKPNRTVGQVLEKNKRLVGSEVGMTPQPRETEWRWTRFWRKLGNTTVTHGAESKKAQGPISGPTTPS